MTRKKMGAATRVILISIEKQRMDCFEDSNLLYTFRISSGRKGVGELKNSLCTPRGWHTVHAVIGSDLAVNSVMVGRVWTGELYTEELAAQFPARDWILTRVIQLDGLEPGRNKGGEVDTLSRYIYIHGTPDSTTLGIPGSQGCIRMHNQDVITLASWVTEKTLVHIGSVNAA